MNIIHAVYVWGDSPRHKRAQANWEQFYANGMIPCHLKTLKRDAFDTLNEARHLPYFKDVLEAGLSCAKPNDVVVWANDDVSFDPGIVNWCHNHPYLDGAVSMRRNESGHMGRELFAFRADVLAEILPQIPDFIQGCPYFDLIVAALIRKRQGIKTTKENLSIDIWPAESPHRLALHEPHPSSWAGPNEHKYPANLWNRKLALQWATTHMPSLKL